MSLAACPSPDRAIAQSPRDQRALVRLDRNELAGSFGDLGTDLPLLVGMILVSGAPPAQTLLVYGLLQILSGLLYGLPMPLQPLKVVAALVIAQGLPAPLIYGAGLSIGAVMLVLTLTGLLGRLAQVVPKAVVRGIQLGLGAKLALLAAGVYMPADGASGFLLAAVGVAIICLLRGSRRWPAALPVVAVGAVYAWFVRTDSSLGGAAAASATNFTPLSMPSPELLIQGFILLGLPQIPLSLGNSLLATQQTVRDLFPGRSVSIRRLGLTYSLMNLLAAPLHGIPVCHGSGGLAGHHAFGARTGGSVIIYGCVFLAAGAALVGGIDLLRFFPLPVLGVLLLFEALALARLSRDLLTNRPALALAATVALCALTLPYGFLMGLGLGTAVHWMRVWKSNAQELRTSHQH